MEYSRLPRFKRTTEIAPFELTGRDREIIRLVHQHRFLDSRQIVALIGASQQPILRRLQLLYHHGYLDRPLSQIDYYQNGGSHPMVYGLGSKATAVLKDGPRFSTWRNWNHKKGAVGRIYLEHALLVSEVMVKIALACRQNGTIRFLTAEELPLPNQSKQRKPFKWHVQLNSRTKLGAIPDRVFALEYRKEHGESEKAFFFLEADRGTMPVIRKNLSQTSFYRKLLAYQTTWAQSIHQRRFGFNRFRVLTVTKSPERVASLINACSQLKSGQGLFLFTDEASLKNCGHIFSLRWHTGRPDEITTLLN